MGRNEENYIFLISFTPGKPLRQSGLLGVEKLGIITLLMSGEKIKYKQVVSR